LPWFSARGAFLAIVLNIGQRGEILKPDDTLLVRCYAIAAPGGRPRLARRVGPGRRWCDAV
jgi:hypothetical protein